MVLYVYCSLEEPFGCSSRGSETLAAEELRRQRAMTKQEAAEMLGVSLRTVDRLIALKELQVRRLGRRVLVPRSALEALWKAQATGLGGKEAP
jgi:excisionase family DNA binding protein